METTSFSETLVFIYHSKQRQSPEDWNLQCSGQFGLKTPINFTALAIFYGRLAMYVELHE
jgi:hypothetical protein